MQIIDWEERYNECLALLRNAQEEIRELQKASKPRVIRYHCTGDSPYVSGDSLAVQLENSIRRSLLYPDECRSVFTSTLLQSRPNKAGLRFPYVCIYVRPSTESFFDFNEIWHVGRGP